MYAAKSGFPVSCFVCVCEMSEDVLTRFGSWYHCCGRVGKQWVFVLNYFPGVSQTKVKTRKKGYAPHTDVTWPLTQPFMYLQKPASFSYKDYNDSVIYSVCLAGLTREL